MIDVNEILNDLDCLTAMQRENSELYTHIEENNMTNQQKANAILKTWIHPTITVKELAIAVFKTRTPNTAERTNASHYLSNATKDNRLERIGKGIYRLNKTQASDTNKLPQELVDAVKEVVALNAELHDKIDAYTAQKSTIQKLKAQLEKEEKNLKELNDNICQMWSVRDKKKDLVADLLDEKDGLRLHLAQNVI